MPHNLPNPTRFIGCAAMSVAIPKDRGMDAVKMGLKEPQEEEMALGNMNQLCYHNVFYNPQNMKSHFKRSIFMEGVQNLIWHGKGNSDNPGMILITEKNNEINIMCGNKRKK